VSIWRALFVANELNERLGATRLNNCATWALMIICLDGFGWRESCRWASNDEVRSNSPYNPLLLYAVPASVWLFVVVAQLIVRRIYEMRNGAELTNFVDICSLANISVFILDEPHHGYYIHGRAPGGKGDASATEMACALHEEGHGLLPKRGLTPESPVRGDLQTFEMLLPGSAKDNIFDLYKHVMAERLGLGSGFGGMTPGAALFNRESSTTLSNFNRSSTNLGGGFGGGTPGNNNFANNFGSGSPLHGGGFNNDSSRSGSPKSGGKNLMASLSGVAKTANIVSGFANAKNLMNNANFVENIAQQNDMHQNFQAPNHESFESKGSGTHNMMGNNVHGSHNQIQNNGFNNNVNFGNYGNNNNFSSGQAQIQSQSNQNFGGMANGMANQNQFFSQGYHRADVPSELSSEAPQGSPLDLPTAGRSSDENLGLESRVTPSASSYSSTKFAAVGNVDKKADTIGAEASDIDKLVAGLGLGEVLKEGSHRMDYNPSHNRSLGSSMGHSMSGASNFGGAQGGNNFNSNNFGGPQGGFGNNNFGGNNHNLSNHGNPTGPGHGGHNNNNFGGGGGNNGSLSGFGAMPDNGFRSLRSGTSLASLPGPALSHTHSGVFGQGFNRADSSQPVNTGALGQQPGGLAGAISSSLTQAFASGLGLSSSAQAPGMLNGGSSRLSFNGFNNGGGSNDAMGSTKKLASLRHHIQDYLIQQVDTVVRSQGSCIKPSRGANGLVALFCPFVVSWCTPNSMSDSSFPDVQDPSFPLTFFEDLSGLAWASILAYGSETVLSFPTGFEFLLLVFEFLLFAVIFRFSLGNLYLAVAIALVAGRLALALRAAVGTRRLAETAMIDARFLL